MLSAACRSLLTHSLLMHYQVQAAPNNVLMAKELEEYAFSQGFKNSTIQ